MNIKLLALAGIMAASMGLTACDSNKENASEDVAAAEEKLDDAQQELNKDEVVDTAAVDAVDEAAVVVDEAAVATETTEVDAEVPADGAAATDPAVVVADDVVVEKPAQ